MAANMQHGGRSNEQRAVAPQLLIDLVTLLVYFGAGGGVTLHPADWSSTHTNFSTTGITSS